MRLTQHTDVTVTESHLLLIICCHVCVNVYRISCKHLHNCTTDASLLANSDMSSVTKTNSAEVLKENQFLSDVKLFCSNIIVMEQTAAISCTIYTPFVQHTSLA